MNTMTRTPLSAQLRKALATAYSMRRMNDDVAYLSRYPEYTMELNAGSLASSLDDARNYFSVCNGFVFTDGPLDTAKALADLEPYANGTQRFIAMTVALAGDYMNMRRLHGDALAREWAGALYERTMAV